MAFEYYNQYSYKDVSYWSAAHPSATIATAGCGVCCACMVLSVFGQKVTPPEMAKTAQKIGARVNTGTDMNILSNYIKTQYGVNLAKTDDASKLRAALKAGKIAICNVGGDRTGYKGVFSNGGHFIVAYGWKDGPIIYDPGFYQNKYDSAYRSARVTVGANNQLFCSLDTLSNDCANRQPRYYVFWSDEIMTVTEAKKIIKAKAGLTDKTIEFLYNYRYGDDLLIKLATAMK